MSVLDFIERAPCVMYCDFLVFIHGQNVTPWITDSIAYNIAGRDGINTASFTLSNAEDIFIITPDNLAGKFRMGGVAVYSEEIKEAIYDFKTIPENNPQDPLTGARKYPIGPYTPIFHRHDPVRIFVKNPITSGDRWLPAFAGYLETKPFVDDYVSGQRTISVTCYDIRGLMKRMRISMTYIGKNVTGAEAIFRDGFFKDARTPSNYGHAFRGKFENSINELLVGSLTRESTFRDGSVENFGGVGSLKPGIDFLFTSTDEIEEKVPDQGERAQFTSNVNSSLEDWYKLGLFGQRRKGDSEEIGSIGNRKDLTLSQCMSIGWESYPGGEFSPDKSFVHFLLPAKGSSAYRITDPQFDDSGTDQYDWTTRYDVISDLMERVDYQW